MCTTFLLIVLAWVFFRSGSIQDACQYLNGIFSFTFFSIPDNFPQTTIILVCIFLIIEWMQRLKEHPLQFNHLWPRYLRWVTYYGLLMMLYIFGGKQQPFIYFKF